MREGERGGLKRKGKREREGERGEEKSKESKRKGYRDPWRGVLVIVK